MRVAKVAAGIVLAAWADCASAEGALKPQVEVPVPPSTTPIPLLLQSLSSSDGSVRAAAAWQLAKVKEPPEEVLYALGDLRTDPERSVRYAAEWALGQGGFGRTTPSDVNETPPKPKRMHNCPYPDAAQQAGIQGEVEIALLVGEEGEVVHAEILTSSCWKWTTPSTRTAVASSRVLDDMAVACVRLWQFEPMRVAGVPRASVVHQTVAFRIH